MGPKLAPCPPPPVTLFSLTLTRGCSTEPNCLIATHISTNQHADPYPSLTGKPQSPLEPGGPISIRKGVGPDRWKKGKLLLVGWGLEDRRWAGARTRAGVYSPLGLVVRALGEASLAAFPELRGTGFRGLLLGLAFLEASRPVNFLLPAGVEAESCVGSIILGFPTPKGVGAGASV